MDAGHVARPRATSEGAGGPDRSHEPLRTEVDPDQGPSLAPTRGPTRGLVKRERLHARLDEIFSARAGQVTGPSGSGKTTLLRAWSSTTTCCDVVWMTSDRAHRDASVLARDLAEAVGRAVGETVSVRGIPADDAVEHIVDVIEQSGSRVAIVFDDAQVLAGTESGEVVRRLLGRNRGALRVLIAGRGILEFGLEELQRRDELLTIAEIDLRLDGRETAAIVRSVSGVDVDDRSLVSIHEQVGGWTAGAVLAGLVLRTSDGPPIATGAAIDRHRLFEHFFSTEVFEGLPTEVRAFLLDTCVLDVLEPGPCAELAQRDDAEDLLWHLETSNTFTSWIGGDPPQFCYHRLLRSWLRRHLAHVDPARALELERRAACWFEARGRTPEAIHHRLATGDFQVAAELIIDFGPRALGEGRYEAVRDWIGSLPEPLRNSDISLLVLLAEVEHRLGHMESTTAIRAILTDRLAHCSDAAVPEHLARTVAVHRGTELVVRGELEAAAVQARRALSMVDLGSWFTVENPLRFEDVLLAMDMASVSDKLMYAGDFAESRRVARWVVEVLRPDDPRATPMRARCLGQLAVCELVDGTRFAAEELALEAIALCRFHGLDPIDIGYAELGLLVAGRQVDRAALHASMERRSSQIDIPAITCLVDLLRSWSYVQSGDLTWAGRLLASAERALATLREPGMLGGLARRVAAIVDVGSDEALLSERERTVLALLATGWTRRSVADQLHLSLNTVKTHARRAYRTLGVRTLDDAVERCGALGIELVARTTEGREAVVARSAVARTDRG